MRFTDGRQGRVATRLLIASAVALTSLAAGGCAADPEPAGAPRKPQITLVRVDRPTGLAELRRDSLAVVIGTAAATGQDTRDGFPVTVTRLNVLTVVSGSLDTTAIEVQQIGTTEVNSPTTSRLMIVGNTYLLYLRKNDGGNLDRYVISGDDGIYAYQDGNYLYYGAPGGRLPAVIGATGLIRFVAQDGEPASTVGDPEN